MKAAQLQREIAGVYRPPSTPVGPRPGFTAPAGGAHVASHEDGGADEINVANLSGELADPQPPKVHASNHENGGSDEISIAGLSGEAADPQIPKAHAADHEAGGGDEISIAGLSGEAADPQPPKTHSHAGLVPAGGTAAQVLSKIDGTDFNTEWADAAAPGGAEIPYGSMYADNAGIAVVVSASDTFYEITSGITGGAEHLCTFQNSHEIKVPVDGAYLIAYSIAGQTASVANKEMEGRIMINNAAQAQGSAHAEVSPGGSGRPEVVSGSGIFDLSADDVISLAVSNHTDTTDFVIEHVSLSVVQMGAQGPEGPTGPGLGTHEATYDHTLLHSNALDHSNANDPTAGEKDALAGTSGAPGVGNEYVTDDDARNSDARTPVAHSHAPADVTGTAVIDSDGRLTDARTPVAHAHAPADVTGTAVIDSDARLSDARQLAAGADKTKLDGIAAGAEVNVNADWNSGSGDSQILNKPTVLAFNDAEGDPANVAAAAADGVSTYAARRDHAHTGALLAAAFSGVAKISVGTGAPGSPAAGDLWVDTN